MNYSTFTRYLFQHRFIRFCIVGGSGFIVDASLFLGLTEIVGVAGLPSRVIAFWGAVTWNWYCNRTFTFQSRSDNQPKLKQWTQYMLASVVGFVPNTGVFWLLTTFTSLKAQPLVALALGITAGLFCNYVLASRIVFQAKTC